MTVVAGFLTSPNDNSRRVRLEDYPEIAHLFEPGESVTVTISKSERKVMRRVKYQKPSEWIPKNVRINRGIMTGRCSVTRSPLI